MAKVYIGVGHGGSDPGAVSGKHKESAYVLDIANACTAELKRHGLTVMQSRTTDVSESAEAKIKECNAWSPDVALDIHLNSGGGDGFEIYHTIYGGEGKELASAVENAVKKLGQNSRGLKTRKNSSGKDYFGFIRQTMCPAVLVECAFIDTADVQLVDTLAERQTMGAAIAKGVLAHFKIEYKPQKTSGETADGSEKKPQTVVVTLPVIGRNISAPVHQVKRVQLCLNQMGWTGSDDKALAVDGIFGKNTEAAVKKLQTAHNITSRGVIEAKTWQALLEFKK